MMKRVVLSLVFFAIVARVGPGYADPAKMSLDETLFIGAGLGNHDAFKALLKAAEQGDPEAQVDIGLLYSMDLGVPKNHLNAVSWWRKAADKNFAGAQMLLGDSY